MAIKIIKCYRFFERDTPVLDVERAVNERDNKEDEDSITMLQNPVGDSQWRSGASWDSIRCCGLAKIEKLWDFVRECAFGNKLLLSGVATDNTILQLLDLA